MVTRILAHFNLHTDLSLAVSPSNESFPALTNSRFLPSPCATQVLTDVTRTAHGVLYTGPTGARDPFPIPDPGHV